MRNRPRTRRPERTNTVTGRIGYALTGLALLLLSSVAVAAVPPEFSAHYFVTLGPLKVGETRIDFERMGENRYSYSSATRTIGAIRLINRTEVSERSEGVITDTGFRPEKYLYTHTGDDGRKSRLEFDWNTGRVANMVDRNPWRIDVPGNTLDRLVTHLQLMHDLSSDIDDLTYKVVDRGSLRTYDLQIIGRGQVRTNIGEFETIQVQRRQKKRDESTTLWLAPALDYLPVRIDHEENGDTFKMVLNNLNGFKLPPR